MNNNNPTIKIELIIDDIFNNTNIKERDKLIVRKYHYLDGDTMKMRELGEENGITKEAIRIILERNKLKVESGASKVAYIFDELAKEITKLAPVRIGRLQEKLLERGYDIGNLCEKGIVESIAIFSRKHKNSVFVDCINGTSIICDSSKPEAAKEIEKIARSESSRNGYASTSTITVKASLVAGSIKSSAVVDVLSCLNEATWISKRFVTFIDSRNRVISRIRKIASLKDTASLKRTCDAINQSISHRDKAFSKIDTSILTKLLLASAPDCIVDKGVINFINVEKTQINDIEMEIHNLLLEHGALELVNIESLVTQIHSKASIYQSCSLSPLILKKAKLYSVV
ncbi:hypothetical protein LMH73_018410 [Vibrio splendidus]|nr:hypothetical protein [Vibrio splendidus]MCC4882985.1 hypothetical protein [Vibrio splendidus]